MSTRLSQWLNWLRGKPGSIAAGKTMDGRAVHELPREQLRAATSMALGPGISRRLTALGQPACRAVDRLEALAAAPSPATRRFGGMLNELSNPDLLVLALIVRDVVDDATPAVKHESARLACDHLGLAADSRHLVEFLVNDDLRMSKLASDVRDSVAIETFASYLNKASMFNAFTAEEHLKALCLMTYATLDAEHALSDARAEHLWRLFAATYNHLTRAYDDEMIDAALAKRTALNIARPPGLTEHELVEFLVTFPRRYLSLFDARSISEHARICRSIGPDEVHCVLNKGGGGLWDLTVATRDRPFLFSNICGVLAYLHADILKGQAMTSSQGIALGVFRFHDDEGMLERSDPKPLLIDAIAGRVNVDHLVPAQMPSDGAAVHESPTVSLDNDASARYTVIEMTAANAPGLLYRVSRAVSDAGCSIDLVVIATEGPRAHDVFHITKQRQKLGPEDQRIVATALERATAGFIRRSS